MTEKELASRINKIRDMANDDESAHAAEDGLREEVLRVIAEGADNAKELAALVLTTSDISFSRWCA